ncbi:hypothetical protein OG978_15840 [Streptomyces sp. NBC_01591]|uniref:hypothetical protein n=1 Tax=Streptomyces sp. NBC_01591 TaxID=2975888 RepID=UPI002DD824A6|nr:hypothetical protein [Streptomyces sp. NBC_01591]WSD73284.1 hypothetical protein OG978_15840 [Streptomyces sp. NBC_01591]
MTFDAEWATIRAEATQRVDMRLNSLPAEGGSGSTASQTDLAVNQNHIGAIGHEAYEVRTRLSKDGDMARSSTFDAAIALTNGNFESGSSLLKVHDRWNTHMKTLLDACGQISNHLNYSASATAKDDQQIEGEMLAVSKLDELLK